MLVREGSVSPAVLSRISLADTRGSVAASLSRDGRIRESFAAFDRVYRLTITALSDFLVSVHPDEAHLYRLWLERGYAEFQAWHSRPRLRCYLTLASCNRLQGLRLLAFVYLHLAYDFPRILAGLLQENHPLPREHYRRVFTAANAVFVDVATAACGQVSTTGIFAPVFKLMPGGRCAAAATSNWLLAHRCSSWMAAEKIAACTDRAKIEDRLWNGIEHAAMQIFDHHNPVHWMRSLPFAGELVDGSTPRSYSS